MKRHHRERGQGRPGHGDARLEEQLKEMRHRHEELRAEVAKLREELQDRPRGGQEGNGKGPAR
jgi:cell division protein FtsB